MPRSAAIAAPKPLLIDAAGHNCVAWRHAAAPAVDPLVAPDLPRGWLPQGPLPLAVVLASSWDEEDMSAYDGERALAEAGIGTLRFEWPDTGDSSADTGTTSIADALAASTLRRIRRSPCRAATGWRSSACASFDAADLPVMLGGFAQTVRHAEALSGLRWPGASSASVREVLLLWPTEPRRQSAIARGCP